MDQEGIFSMEGEREENGLKGGESGSSNSSLDVEQELSTSGRVIHRKKKIPGRPDGQPNGLSESAPTHNSFLATATAKNSRKSRNAFTHSRGEPKKGGAGGKGVWGKPGSEIDETGITEDVHDPNYDSDNQGDYTLEEVECILNKKQIESILKPALLEYFNHGKTSEVEIFLSGLNIGPNMHEVVKECVRTALEKHNPQREMVSRLISDLYGGMFSSTSIGRAFDELLESIDDLVLDTPDAALLLGQFIARCVGDDCLPPKYISGYKGKVKNDKVKDALEKAEVLLSMNHGLAHLDNIWGVGGGNRPVKSLTNKMVDLLKEYLNSADQEEARRCLTELEVPHFHHEFVYQAGVLVIEESTGLGVKRMSDLLKYFVSANLVSQEEFDKGMRRLYQGLPDLLLDVPAAYAMIELYVTKLNAYGLVNSELAQEMPQSARGRKRFVSESEYGRLKAV